MRNLVCNSMNHQPGQNISGSHKLSESNEPSEYSIRLLRMIYDMHMVYDIKI